MYRNFQFKASSDIKENLLVQSHSNVIEANTLALKGGVALVPRFPLDCKMIVFPIIIAARKGRSVGLKHRPGPHARVCFFKKPRRQVKRLEAEQLPQEEAQRIKKNRTEATTLAIVLLALVITYLPAIMVGVLTVAPTGNIFA